jgi:hypothetical protein
MSVGFGGALGAAVASIAQRVAGRVAAGRRNRTASKAAKVGALYAAAQSTNPARDEGPYAAYP